MKKNLLIVAVLAIFAGLFSACDPIEVTDEALLTQSKGWVLSAGTSSPTYALSNGSFANDLIKDGYLKDCEVDDILYFHANGGLVINPGANVCDETDAEFASTWKLTSDENGKFLEYQIPFFDDDELEVAEVLALSADELRVKYTFTAVESPAKGTDYSFTLTYVPVK